MISARRSLERRRPGARHAGARADGGFTVVELVVVVFVLGVVFSIGTALLVAFNQQSADIADSVTGVRQATLASQTLVQYLRGASQVLAVYSSAGTQVGPSATELDAVVSEGFDTTTYTSRCTNLDALWFKPGTGSNPDAEFKVTFDVPPKGPANGGAVPPAPWSSITPSSAAPTAFNPVSSCTPASATTRTVGTYFAVGSQDPRTRPVFTYWAYNAASQLYQLPIEDPVPACAIGEIAAIGVHVTFLAGPQQPTEGFAADQPTTLDTTVYLRGASTTATAPTTTTSTTSPCPE